jgi:hypothetical protein
VVSSTHFWVFVKCIILVDWHKICIFYAISDAKTPRNLASLLLSPVRLMKKEKKIMTFFEKF